VLQSVLSAHYYLTTFLPLSHPQFYLPTLFRIWESINSYMYDERMLQFLSKLAEMHVAPEVSDPKLLTEIEDDEMSEGEERPKWPSANPQSQSQWTGLYKDVGIFTEQEWNVLMCKCLASMGRSAKIADVTSDLKPKLHRDSSGRWWLSHHRAHSRQSGWLRDW